MMSSEELRVTIRRKIDMAEARRSIDIDAPREIVFGVIADFAKYPEFLPETKTVEIHGEGDDWAEVSFEIDVVAKVGYTLRFKKNAPERLVWTFVRGNYMKDNQGSWVLEDLGDGRTKATYSIDLKFGALVPRLIEKKLAEVNLPTLLKRFKERSEEAARKV